MKKLLIGLMIVLLTNVCVADISESDYTDMSTKIARLHAASEVRAEFQALFADLDARLVRIASRRSELGTADDIIPQGYFDAATSLYNSLKNGSTNMQAGSIVFLTGSDGGE